MTEANVTSADVLQGEVRPAGGGKTMVYVGWAISLLCIAALGVDAAMKLMKLPAAVQESARVGLSEDVVFCLGFVLLVPLLLYAYPRTAVVGAILLTGYLGGAIAIHVRDGSEPLPILIAGSVGVLVWLGIFLRDARLRELIPLRSTRWATRVV